MLRATTGGQRPSDKSSNQDLSQSWHFLLDGKVTRDKDNLLIWSIRHQKFIVQKFIWKLRRLTAWPFAIIVNFQPISLCVSMSEKVLRGTQVRSPVLPLVAVMKSWNTWGTWASAASWAQLKTVSWSLVLTKNSCFAHRGWFFRDFS